MRPVLLDLCCREGGASARLRPPAGFDVIGVDIAPQARYPYPFLLADALVRPGEAMHIVGNFSGVPLAREVMGAPWMSREGLREAIPPVYAEHVGRQLLEAL